ncbi:MAG: hypothetical protein F6K39_15390 [Okeania sp. SIO3B3]|nr:hypothetical protein [Okeania sp. SIO3B3]
MAVSIQLLAVNSQLFSDIYFMEYLKQKLVENQQYDWRQNYNQIFSKIPPFWNYSLV